MSIRVCKNRVEEEIFYLYTRIKGIQQSLEHTGFTHQILEEDLYYLSNLLILRLVDYFDDRRDKDWFNKNKSKTEEYLNTYHFFDTDRNYSKEELDKFKLFYTTYKMLRNKHVAHYDKNDISFKSKYVDLKIFSDIINTLFQAEVNINNFNAEVFFSYPLVALNMFATDKEEGRTLPFLVSLNKSQRKCFTNNKDILISPHKIQKIQV